MKSFSDKVKDFNPSWWNQVTTHVENSFKCHYNLMLILIHFRGLCYKYKNVLQFWQSNFTGGQYVLSPVLTHSSVLPDTIQFLNTGNFISSGLSSILKNGCQKENSYAGKMYNLADGLCFMGQDAYYMPNYKRKHRDHLHVKAKMSTELRIKITRGLSHKGRDPGIIANKMFII